MSRSCGAKESRDCSSLTNLCNTYYIFLCAIIRRGHRSGPKLKDSGRDASVWLEFMCVVEELGNSCVNFFSFCLLPTLYDKVFHVLVGFIVI